ncbi:MAG: hypothetical protein AB7G06_05410 [Bdellovibrionales bacterium]
MNALRKPLPVEGILDCNPNFVQVLEGTAPAALARVVLGGTKASSGHDVKAP